MGMSKFSQESLHVNSVRYNLYAYPVTLSTIMDGVGLMNKTIWNDVSSLLAKDYDLEK